MWETAPKCPPRVGSLPGHGAAAQHPATPGNNALPHSGPCHSLRNSQIWEELAEAGVNRFQWWNKALGGWHVEQVEAPGCAFPGWGGPGKGPSGSGLPGQQACMGLGLTNPCWPRPQLYLRELLRLTHVRFYQHLVSLGEDGLQMLFCHRWLLLCFKREFPEAEALRIWEACWAHYQVSQGRGQEACWVYYQVSQGRGQGRGGWDHGP